MSYSDDDFEDNTPQVSSRQEAPTSYASSAARTPQQDTVLSELKLDNMKLRRQLSSVNTQLDEHLSRKGQKLGFRPAPSSGAVKHTTVVDQRRAHNDRLRKRNQKIEVELDKKDLPRYRELKNLIGELSRQEEIVRDENRSLENVHQNQRNKLSGVEKIEGEMKAAKAETTHALHEFKHRQREAKEERMRTEDATNLLRRQLERLVQKLRVQDSVGPTVRSYADLQVQAEEKDRTIESLKYQVAVLSKTNVTDKKRSKARHGKLHQQMKDMQDEIDYLRDKLHARGMADELGVDDRY